MRHRTVAEEKDLGDHYTQLAEKLVVDFTVEECNALLKDELDSLTPDASANYVAMHNILSKAQSEGDNDCFLYDIFMKELIRKRRLFVDKLPEEILVVLALMLQRRPDSEKIPILREITKTSSTLLRIFRPELKKPAAEKLMDLMLKGKNDEALKMISADPILLFIQTSGMDYVVSFDGSRRTVFGSPLQAILGALDISLCKAVEPYINMIDEKEIDMLHKVQPHVAQYYINDEATANCELILLSSPPKKENINELPIHFNTAFLRYNDMLIYVNKAKNIYLALKINEATLQEFDAALKPDSEGKILSKDQLNKITAITGYTQVSNGRQLALVQFNKQFPNGIENKPSTYNFTAVVNAITAEQFVNGKVSDDTEMVLTGFRHDVDSGEIRSGKHLDLQIVVRAIEIYIANYVAWEQADNWSGKKRTLFEINVISYLLRLAPTCDAKVFRKGFSNLPENMDQLEQSLDISVDSVSNFYYPTAGRPREGLGATFFLDIYDGRAARRVSPGTMPGLSPRLKYYIEQKHQPWNILSSERNSRPTKSR